MKIEGDMITAISQLDEAAKDAHDGTVGLEQFLTWEDGQRIAIINGLQKLPPSEPTAAVTQLTALQSDWSKFQQGVSFALEFVVWSLQSAPQYKPPAPWPP